MPDGASSSEESEFDRVGGLLHALTAGSKLGIEMLKPRRGWLETLTVPEDADPDWILYTLRENYGPGEFRLRPMGKTERGTHGYLPGGITLAIAERPERKPMAPVPYLHAPPPRAAAQSTELVSVLGNLVAQLAGTSSGVERARFESIQQQIQALSQVRAPMHPQAGMGDLVALLGSLRELGFINNTPVSEKQDDLPSMERMMMMMFMSKMMGESGQKMPPGMARMAAMSGFPMARPAPAARPATPPQAPPQAPAPAPAAAAAAADESEEYEELTPDEVLEHLGGLDPAQALAFLDGVMTNLPAEVQAAIRNLQAQGGSP